MSKSLPEIIENNLVGLYEVYEAPGGTSPACGVREALESCVRHALGARQAQARRAVRPDGFYGLSKVLGEAMARMQLDKHGHRGHFEVIGTAMGTPPTICCT